MGFRGDAETFLRLAAEAGLWVIARPGPYICSEWDGGGLPAYLYAKQPPMKLRDNDPVFLEHVGRWYDKIMPILQKQQAGAGGSVICVQLDNELDFYDCDDPKGYISALRDLALTYGIRVPLTACAGQGGLLQASGLAEGVVPTCNFYPHDRDPEFESKALHYREKLADLHVPLLVTETNRTHYLLRRLLSAGAKLLGPYLQVSGTNFGFTNATNNWGKPLAFLASDYDFGGMISPEGHIRPEAYEGRLLGRLIRAYGAALAEAEPAAKPAWKAEGDTEHVFGPFALGLAGGGQLVFITNGDERDKRIALRAADEGLLLPSSGTLKLCGLRSLALPVDVPLSVWGLPGRIVYSTAELYMAERQEGGTVLAFHAAGSGEIALAIDAPVASAAAEQATLEQTDRQLRVRFAGTGTALCRIRLEDGRLLTLIVTDYLKALYTESISINGKITVTLPSAETEQPADNVAGNWRLSLADGGKLGGYADKVGEASSQAPFLEQLGVYRGFAWYEASALVPVGAKIRGFLVRQGSDVISLYAGGRYIGTATPGGRSAFISAEMEDFPGGTLGLQVRAEIWGHTNFDDARLPGLRLPALKGISGLTAVTRVRDISSNWRVFQRAAEAIGAGVAEVRGTARTGKTAKAEMIDKAKMIDKTDKIARIDPADESLWPLVGFGGWLTADQRSHEIFRREFEPSSGAAAWVLHFKGLEAEARLEVNGNDAGPVRRFDPFIDITPYVTPGETVRLTVYLKRTLGQSAGRVIIYEGYAANGFTVFAAEEPQLTASAEAAQASAAAQELPLTLASGAAGWLFGRVKSSAAGKGWRVRAAGSGLKLTVFMGERIVGRLWLPGGAARPVIAGGSADSFYLPGPWLGAEGEPLSIFLEAVDPQAHGKLESLDFIPV
ncbi:MAG: beta-galactosidase [Paenibacillus macerans]|nr:beta-galactosidase [Paenibacillus macerans]MBS5910439.1 beta-galactosidase [Paenibacillus macerans]